MQSLKLPNIPPGALALGRAAHPGTASAFAGLMALAAMVSGGRSVVEVLMVFVTVLVGTITIGWVNEIADERRDLAADRQAKPLVNGALKAGTLRWATAYAVCLLLPMSIYHGVEAGIAYLLSVILAWAGCFVLRSTPASPAMTSLSFALLPAFLSYGGSGGGLQGDPPTWLMTVLFALLGAVAHIALSIPDVLGDHASGTRNLTLRLALKFGMTRLVPATGIAVALLLLAILATGLTVGLRQ